MNESFIAKTKRFVGLRSLIVTPALMAPVLMASALVPTIGAKAAQASPQSYRQYLEIANDKAAANNFPTASALYQEAARLASNDCEAFGALRGVSAAFAGMAIDHAMKGQVQRKELAQLAFQQQFKQLTELSPTNQDCRS